MRRGREREREKAVTSLAATTAQAKRGSVLCKVLGGRGGGGDSVSEKTSRQSVVCFFVAFFFLLFFFVIFHPIFTCDL